MNNTRIKPSGFNVAAVNYCTSARYLYVVGETDGFRLTDTVDIYQSLSLGRYFSFMASGMEFGGPIPDLSSLANPIETGFSVRGMLLLDLSANLFTGTIPSWMLDFHFVWLSLRDNLLSGQINVLPPPLPYTLSFTLFNMVISIPIPPRFNLERNKFSALKSNFWSEGVYSGELVSLDYAKNYNSQDVYLNLIGNGNASTGFFELESSSFRGLNADRLYLSDLKIEKIPSYLFGNEDSSGKTLSLRSMGISQIEPFAFAGTTNLQIHMSGNYITKLSPNAFPKGTIRGSSCMDLVLWRMVVEDYNGDSAYELPDYNCSTISLLNNNKCERGETCLAIGLQTRGAADRTAVEACCLYGGGYRYGDGLLMDAYSPIFCRPRNETSDEVLCECTVLNSRYNINETMCVQSCESGEYWLEEYHYGMISPSGRCVPCEEGSINTGSESFPSSCEKCSRGTFSNEMSASSCQSCQANEFSTSGSVSCSACPFGKSSDSGDKSCRGCNFLYMGSKHCTSAYGGIAIAVILILIALIIACIIYRYRRKTNKMMSHIVETRHLMQAQTEDIELLSHAWIINSEEVKFTKQIARGGYGEVWRGILRDTYVSLSISISLSHAHTHTH